MDPARARKSLPRLAVESPGFSSCLSCVPPVNLPHCSLGCGSPVPPEAIRNTEPECIAAGMAGQRPRWIGSGPQTSRVEHTLPARNSHRGQCASLSCEDAGVDGWRVLADTFLYGEL